MLLAHLTITQPPTGNPEHRAPNLQDKTDDKCSANSSTDTKKDISYDMTSLGEHVKHLLLLESVKR